MRIRILSLAAREALALSADQAGRLAARSTRPLPPAPLPRKQ